MADPSSDGPEASPAHLIVVLLSMSTATSAADVEQFDQRDLGGVLGAVRTAQRALDGLVVRLGIAAERSAAIGNGRGAHGLLLGDGRSVRGSTARREARRAKTVADLPLAGEALERDGIGAAHVDVLTQAMSSLPEVLHPVLNQPGLIAEAAADPVDVFARRVRRFVEYLKGDHGLGDSEAKREMSTWRSWFDEQTGMGHVHGEFDPERYEAICGAVEAHLTRLSNRDGSKKTTNLAAAASYELLTGESGRAAGRPHIGVLVDWKTFATGAHSNSLREHGGSTDLCNLVPLCGEHHHQVHEGQWRLELTEDRRLDIRDPDNMLWASTRPDRQCASSPAEARPGGNVEVTARTRRRRRHQPIRSAAP